MAKKGKGSKPAASTMKELWKRGTLPKGTKKIMSKAQFKKLGPELKWDLEDLMADYFSLITARGGLYTEIKPHPVRLEIVLFDYDEDDHTKAILTPQRDGSLEVTIFDILNGKRVSKTTWKVLGPDPAERLWKLILKSSGAHEVWDSYR